MSRRPGPLAFALALAAASPALAWEASPAARGGDYAARLAASAPIKGPDGKPKTPVLTVGCAGAGLYATLTWPEPIPLKPGQHFVTVGWSLDGAGRRSAMLASPGSVGLGGSQAGEWLREMAGSKTLNVTVPDARGGQSASFDVRGAARVQAGIARSRCG